MFKNYLQTILRKARKDLIYTGINLVGLAIGISSFLFIIQYVRYEFDIDSFHENSDRIYRLTADIKWNTMENQFPSTPPALGTAITYNFDEVTYVTRIRAYSETIVVRDEDLYKESSLMAVDSNFLKIFNFRLLAGNRETVFRDKYSVVLPESYVTKYFGTEDPLNQSLKIDDKEYKVTGIIEDAPKHSHIAYGPLVSILGDEGVAFFEWSWIWHNLVTYVKIEPTSSKEDVESKIPLLIMDNASPALERITGKTIEQFFAEGNHLGYFLQPLQDVYYDNNQLGPQADKKYLYVFAAVAFLILALACINYMNLSTARSANRAKEVGLRKVLGTSRNQLIYQFLLEAFVYSIIATILAIGFGELAGSMLTDAFGIRWDLSFISSIESIAIVFLISSLVGIVSGLYPAFYLSSFQPSRTLYGFHQKGESKSFMRNLLVIFQFIISFGTIIFAFTAHSQIKFLQDRDLGFDKDRILIVKNVDHTSNRNVFKNEVKQLSSVVNASLSSAIPADGLYGEIFKKKEKWDEDFLFTLMEADEDFIGTLGIQIEEGKNFSAADRKKEDPYILINQQAKKELELGENTLGTQLAAMDREGSLEIIGITKNFDFYLGSIDMGPMVIRPYFEDEPNRTIRYLIINMDTQSIQKFLVEIENIWKNQNTGVPFEYSFVEQIFAKSFQNETRLSGLLGIFSTMAIVIALLGLIGLISYHTEQMKQSIGVRKILGATMGSIVLLITTDFIKLLLIAIVIAVPVVNYFIVGWLEDFAYGMPLTAIYFILPGISLIAISLLIIWAHSLRAAQANPIEAIRSE